MKTERIKTNIIELLKLKKLPCKEWLDRFKDGKIDAHEDFKLHGQRYSFLYLYSNYDLIGWEISNNVFDWSNFSWAVAVYCPQNFDPEKFNWEDFSGEVAKYCPDRIEDKRYNWAKFSKHVARYCPDKLDPDRYNWEKYSHSVAQFCPDRIQPDKFNWSKAIFWVKMCCPKKLDLMPEKYKKLYTNNV